MARSIRKTQQDGFTLIELLIVIIILGILAAIVVFAVGSTRGDAVKSTCVTDVKSIVLAEEAFNTNNTAYTNDKTKLTTLKSWPTTGATATTDNLVLDLSTVAGDGGYTAAKTVTQKDTSDGAVNTACTTTA